MLGMQWISIFKNPPAARFGQILHPQIQPEPGLALDLEENYYSLL